MAPSWDPRGEADAAWRTVRRVQSICSVKCLWTSRVGNGLAFAGLSFVDRHGARAVLEREPYHGGAALRLARQEAEAGRAEAARALAVRAARFGGGPEAKEFLRQRLAVDAG